MRVLLDEGVPVQIRTALTGHDISTVQSQGWSGVGNGELLTLAEHAGFDLLIVADKNLRYQQNLAGRRIALLELWTNHRPTLEKHLARIQVVANRTTPGAYLVLDPV